jgi:uncharacterized protein (TIGR02118 family)
MLYPRRRRPIDEGGDVVRFIVIWKNTPTDVDAFERHYREVHIPLAKRLPGLRRYTLSRNVSRVRGDDPHYLIAELDWDDMASFQRDVQSPDGKATGADVELMSQWSPGVQSMVYELEDV